MADSEHLGIAVIESQWYPRYQISVKPLFNFLSDVYCDRPDGFVYERFVGAKSFAEVHAFAIAQSRVRYIYVASHGEKDSIEAPNGDSISRQAIRDDICRYGGGKKRNRIRGLYLGSCLFGGSQNMAVLFEDTDQGPNTLQWIAGYREEVDFLESSCLDLIFWQTLLDREESSELKRLSAARDYVVKSCDGLVKALGFGIWVRNSAGAGARDLVTGEGG
jgi:hypothetical protein